MPIVVKKLSPWLFSLGFALVGCASQMDKRASLNGLTFEVTSQLADSELELTAFITNESSTPKDL